ncbi:MAG: VCBS repeat-containing protein [Vicinamibacterales bacterium]
MRGATSIQFADYDNDGLLDIIGAVPAGLAVLRNVGPSWVDVTDDAVTSGSPVTAGVVRSTTFADVDRDGDLDVVSSSGERAWLWRNSGDPRNRGLRVQLRGRVTNRPGVGSKVQMRAGSLSARAETSATSPAVAPSEIVFGLGPRPGADVVRVLWPSGILQAETAARTGQDTESFLPSPFLVEELESEAIVVSVPLRVERRTIRVRDRLPRRRRDRGTGKVQVPGIIPIRSNTSASPATVSCP